MQLYRARWPLLCPMEVKSKVVGMLKNGYLPLYVVRYSSWATTDLSLG